MNIISILYNLIFIPIGRLLILILKFFNKKIADKENNFRKALESLNKIEGHRRIWFHTASMGEFEQAVPIIEILKSRNPDIKIIVSFYSPSGYNNRKNFPLADAVCYLPFDSKRNAKKFIDVVKPDAAVFVRYEIWRNLMEELSKRRIPAYLIDATRHNGKFANNNFLMRIFFKSTYNYFSEIFVINVEHSEYFKSLNLSTKTTVLSDTRFDRIYNKVTSAKEKPILNNVIFDESDFILIAGSCWEPDETLMNSAMKLLPKNISDSIRIIFVPHEPTTEHIEKLSAKLDEYILFSRINETGKLKERHIIVDSIGKLLGLYSIADAAYIGGAFGVGVHSTAEPAGYGIPLSCGTKMKNSPDAINLQKLGALQVVSTPAELAAWLEEIITSKENRLAIGEIARNYVNSSIGSSQIIAEKLLGIH
ncbi:MAG: 3-deoxy-D-manno-octulosonic acid transferase [Ignavibacteria bacterium]|nr:3-deoxy-D-manno-octulosonic acid transferase [Ignavibacteria bacterium]